MSRRIRRLLAVLATTAATVGLMTSLAAPAQAETRYYFVNVKSDYKCMLVESGGGATDGAHVVLNPCEGVAQLWNQENLDANGYYRYRNVVSGKCLSVAGGGSTASGAEIIQWTCNGGPEQQWKLFYSGDYHSLRNLKSGLTIMPAGGTVDDNTRLVQVPYNGTLAQLWEMV